MFKIVPAIVLDAFFLDKNIRLVIFCSFAADTAFWLYLHKTSTSLYKMLVWNFTGDFLNIF